MNSKWTLDFNVKEKTMKLLEKYRRAIFPTLCWVKSFYM